MKIALVTSHYGPPWNEGVRNIARCLVDFLESKGEEVTVISPRLMSRSGKAAALVRRIPLLRSLAFALLAMVWTKRADPDVVLMFASVSPALGIKSWLLSLAVKRPQVLYITGLRPWIFGYRLLLRARKILVNSDVLKGLFPGAEIVPPFLDPTKWAKRTGPAPSSKTVLFLGAFQRCRGVEYLIRAMSLLDGRAQARLILAWNGAGRSRYRHILRTIKRSRVEDKVELLHTVDAPSLYAQASVVVIPRISPEKMTFPLRIIEALTVGVPLVVTRVNRMDQIIDGCGVAVAPRNERDLAVAIERLLTDRELYERCVEACQRKAEEYSSTQSLEKLYEGLKICL